MKKQIGIWAKRKAKRTVRKAKALSSNVGAKNGSPVQGKEKKG